MKQPIDTITWLEPFELKANSYNPNVVFNAELRLLELSIVKHGWLHPILVHKESMEIIDGFHRWTITQDSKSLQAAHGTKLPCILLELTVPERMLLTVRINRAKGSHIAVKMSDIVKSLVEEHAMSIEDVAKEIGGGEGGGRAASAGQHFQGEGHAEPQVQPCMEAPHGSEAIHAYFFPQFT